MKRNFGVCTFISSIAFMIGFSSQALQAEEILPWLQEAGKLIQNHRKSVYYNTVSPNTLQYYIYTIPNNQAQQIKNQFRDAAEGEFHRICTANSGANGFRPLVLGSNDPTRFYFIQWREENGNINCYRRGTR